MTLGPRATIFVSYSHKDHEEDELVRRVMQHVGGLARASDADLWIDKQLNVGAEWYAEIMKQVNDASLALLLLSPAFMESEFIQSHELPNLRARAKSSAEASSPPLHLVPVVIRPVAWEYIDWLAKLQIWPANNQSLAEIAEHGSLEVERSLKELVQQLATKIRAKPSQITSTSNAQNKATSDAFTSAVRLVRSALLDSVPGDAADELAQRLVDRVREFHGVQGKRLLLAVRFCIEFHLLDADDLVSVLLLELSSQDTTAHPHLSRLRTALKERLTSGDFTHTPIDVTSDFFARVRARETLWFKYFDELTKVSFGAVAADSVQTLCRIRVLVGFIAPQHLVCGLLSRFDDDWKPVLDYYEEMVGLASNRSETGDANFERLQTSQWSTWLVWGPSIPICRCEQWRGIFALQFGYGDENNSIPIIEQGAVPDQPPERLERTCLALRTQSRAAAAVELTGRLRWGPWFLERYDPAKSKAVGRLPLSRRNRVSSAPALKKFGAAAAQENLFSGERFLHSHHSDGILLEIDDAESDVDGLDRVYFSSYLWLMFLVATADTVPDAGPKLLRGKAYPPWPDSPRDRKRVREKRLWDDLLPVFVHANLADPVVLRTQQGLLVENALALLRKVWSERSSMFDAEDQRTGIRFYLVSASDYTGCGDEARYPSQHSLLALLRAALAAESDREFQSAVSVPEAPKEPARPPLLAGYFSACHLPELVVDYYQHLEELSKKARETF